MTTRHGHSRSSNYLHVIADNTTLSDVSLKYRYELAEIRKISYNLGLDDSRKNMFNRMSVKGRNIDKDIKLAMAHLHEKKMLQIKGEKLPEKYKYKSPENKIIQSEEIKDFIYERRSLIENLIPSFNVQYSTLPQVKDKKENIFDISEISSLNSYQSSIANDEIRRDSIDKRRKHIVINNEIINKAMKRSQKKQMSVVELYHLNDSPIKNRKVSNLDNNLDSPVKKALTRSSKILDRVEGENIQNISRRQAIDPMRVYNKRVSIDGNEDYIFDKVGWSVDRKSIDSKLVRIKTLNKRKKYGRIKPSPKKQSILNSNSLNCSVSDFILNSNSIDDLSNALMEGDLKKEDDFKVHLDENGGMTLIKNYLLTPRRRESITLENSAIRKSTLVTNGRVSLNQLVDEQEMSYEPSILKIKQVKSSFRSIEPSFRLDSKRLLSSVGKHVIDNSKINFESRIMEQKNILNLKHIREKNTDIINKFKSERLGKFITGVSENRNKMESIDQEIKKLIYNASQIYDKYDKKIQKNIKELY
jgi:hypothetical protein